MEDFNGLLLIDKPQDWTSFDVVAKVRGIIKHETGQKVKVGHTGTLDPKATGLLVLAIGSYTKRVPELTKLDKIYVAEVMLGKTSSTDDSEGEFTEVSDKVPTLDEIEATLEGFLGEIEQIPPQFSAIKVDGKRAYKSARDGQEVKLEPRKVRIKSINDLKYDYPKMSFVTDVSSGTYIRSLARDIGKELGTGAYLSALRRETVGEYSISTAIPMEGIDLEKIRRHLLLL